MSQHFSRYHFKGQREGEEIIEVVHRHWFNIAAHYIVVFFFCLVLFGSVFLLPLLFPDLASTETAIIFLFLQNLFVLVFWLYSFLIWIDYYFDVWIITNERVVNIEQKGLFVREVSELRFNKVQDVTTEVKGLIPTMLNFGEVHVQTAAEEDRFLFHAVPDPYRLRDVIMRRVREAHEADLKSMNFSKING